MQLSELSKPGKGVARIAALFRVVGLAPVQAVVQTPAVDQRPAAVQVTDQAVLQRPTKLKLLGCWTQTVMQC